MKQKELQFFTLLHYSVFDTETRNMVIKDLFSSIIIAMLRLFCFENILHSKITLGFKTKKMLSVQSRFFLGKHYFLVLELILQKVTEIIFLRMSYRCPVPTFQKLVQKSTKSPFGNCK